LSPSWQVALLPDPEEFLGDTGCGGDLRATTIQLFRVRSAGLAWHEYLPCGFLGRDAERLGMTVSFRKAPLQTIPLAEDPRGAVFTQASSRLEFELLPDGVNRNYRPLRGCASIST